VIRSGPSAPAVPGVQAEAGSAAKIAGFIRTAVHSGRPAAS
jgi:hypothetical protein